LLIVGGKFSSNVKPGRTAVEVAKLPCFHDASAPGPPRFGTQDQRRFQASGPIGRQKEYDARFFLEIVPFIEPFVEQDFLAGADHPVPVTGDQVHVFQHHDARLQEMSQNQKFAERNYLFSYHVQRRVPSNGRARS
jgi:hypothetical protein